MRVQKDAHSSDRPGSRHDRPTKRIDASRTNRGCDDNDRDGVDHHDGGTARQRLGRSTGRAGASFRGMPAGAEGVAAAGNR